MPARVPSILPLSSGRLLIHTLSPRPLGRVGIIGKFFWVSPDGNAHRHTAGHPRGGQAPHPFLDAGRNPQGVRQVL